MRLRRRRHGGHDITCRDAVALLSRYLDGELAGDDLGRLEAHLHECDDCTEHLAQLRLTVALTGRIREEDLEPPAREDLMEIYRRWRDETGR